MRVYRTGNSVYPEFENEAGVRAIFAQGGAHIGDLFGVIGFLDPDRMESDVVDSHVEFRWKSDGSVIEYDDLPAVLEQEPSEGKHIVAMLRRDGEFVRRGPDNYIVTSQIAEIKEVEI